MHEINPALILQHLHNTIALTPGHVPPTRVSKSFTAEHQTSAFMSSEVYMRKILKAAD